MDNKDILISDLEDISEILSNNGYGGWSNAIQKAICAIKDQPEIVRCKDCCMGEPSTQREGYTYCHLNGGCNKNDSFCSEAVRKDGDKE